MKYSSPAGLIEYLSSDVKIDKDSFREETYLNYVQNSAKLLPGSYDLCSYEIFFEYLLNKISENFKWKKKKLLDVGCGVGNESLIFALEGFEVHGLDMKSNRLEAAREVSKKVTEDFNQELDINYKYGSILELEHDEKFDFVFMKNTFHHLEPRGEVIKKCSNVLTQGGWLILWELNGLNPLLQLKMLKQRGFSTVETFEDKNGREHLYGNERIFSLNYIKNKLDSYGFELSYYKYGRVFPRAINKFLNNKILLNIDKLLSWKVLSFIPINYVAILEKCE